MNKYKKCNKCRVQTGSCILHIRAPPQGGVQSRNHANFSPFSRNHARIFQLSRNHTNWSHFSSFTQSRTDFFRFHAITQIRKGFSRHHAHQKDLSRITHTCQLHAITQLYFHFHAITHFSRNKKGHSRNHANLWGASYTLGRRVEENMQTLFDL